MKLNDDPSLHYLALADRETLAFTQLSPNRKIDDDILGLHAHRAVENILRAVLARHKIEAPETASLEKLLEAFAANNKHLPPNRLEILELSPFSEVLTKGYLQEKRHIYRAPVEGLLTSLREWAMFQLKNHDFLDKTSTALK